MTMALGFAMVAAATAGPVVNADSVGVHREMLRDALAARERPRREGAQYYCFYDSITRPAYPHKVCRTRDDWQVLGLDPIDE